MNETGCFGKVPAHGDFVWQGLPARFVTPWDNWLQERLLALQRTRPDDWLETYLCGPIWRFLLRDESLGHQTWCGIVSPSVDIVGRYFPCTIATALPRYAHLASTTRLMEPWLALAEETALAALSDTLPVETLLERVCAISLPEIGERAPLEEAEAREIWSGHVGRGQLWAEQMIDEVIHSSYQQPCHWSRVDAETGEVDYLMSEGFQSFERLFTG